MLRTIQLLVVLGLTQTAVAQQAPVAEKKKNDAHFGLRAGFNGSVTTAGFGNGNSFKDPSIKAGTYAGVFVTIPVASQWNFQPELIYSGEGSLQDGLIGNVSDNRYVLVLTTRLQFLNLPLLIQYNKGTGFYAETGPQAGFLLNAKLKNEFPAPGQEAETKINGTNNTTLSWVAGIGYTLQSGLGFGVRYTLGMSKYIDGFNEQRVNTVQLGLQYHFKKKK